MRPDRRVIVTQTVAYALAPSAVTVNESHVAKDGKRDSFLHTALVKLCRDWPALTTSSSSHASRPERR